MLLQQLNFLKQLSCLLLSVEAPDTSLSSPLADQFLTYILFPPYIVFFTYSVMLVALVLLFFFKQHSNLLLLLLYIELCLFLIGFLFVLLFTVSFSYFNGLVYGLTILALSAAEAIIGLSLLLVYFKANRGSVSVKSFSLWKNS